MTFFHSVVPIPMGYIVAAIAVVAALLVMWLATLLSRRLYVTIRKSEETELMAVYLSRIADSLDRLAATREPRLELTHLESAESGEPRVEPARESSEPRSASMSMFGL
jgi:hypothetical protein